MGAVRLANTDWVNWRGLLPKTVVLNLGGYDPWGSKDPFTGVADIYITIHNSIKIRVMK